MKPTGTIFQRTHPTSEPGAREHIALYGLLELPEGLPCERMYGAAVAIGPGRFQVKIEPRPLPATRAEEYLGANSGPDGVEGLMLSDLGTAAVWRCESERIDEETAVAYGAIYLRDADVPAPHGRTAMYLAVSVMRFPQGIAGPGECLRDLVDGFSSAPVCCRDSSVGRQPDGVVRAPFFLRDGERHAIQHTLGPGPVRQLSIVRNALNRGEAEWSSEERQAVEAAATDGGATMAGWHIRQRRQDTHFDAFCKGRGDGPLSNQLFSAAEHTETERKSKALMAQIMIEAEGAPTASSAAAPRVSG